MRPPLVGTKQREARSPYALVLPDWKSNPTEAMVPGRARSSNAAWAERLDKFWEAHGVARQDVDDGDDDAEEDSDEDGPMPKTSKNVVGGVLQFGRKPLPNGLSESSPAWQLGFAHHEGSMLPQWTLIDFSQICFIYPPFAFPPLVFLPYY